MSAPRRSVWCSKKFWVSLLTAVGAVVLPAVGVAVPIAAPIAGLVYVLAEGLADAAGAFRAKE